MVFHRVVTLRMLGGQVGCTTACEQTLQDNYTALASRLEREGSQTMLLLAAVYPIFALADNQGTWTRP
jgi:hypothetical protein